MVDLKFKDPVNISGSFFLSFIYYIYKMNRAKNLLDSINELDALSNFRANTNIKAVWNAAFVLYRREHPRNLMRSGCESCRKVVYNWLRTNAEE